MIEKKEKDTHKVFNKTGETVIAISKIKTIMNECYLKSYARTWKLKQR